MEKKKLHSLLNSSPEDFLSFLTKQPPKSSKPSLKPLIHSIPPSSNLSKSLPPSLLLLISNSLQSFNSPPSPSNSPAHKRPRRSSSRHANPSHDPNCSKELQILAHIVFLCLSHPKKVFDPSSLLPAVRSLHDTLIIFESDQCLSSEVLNLCEEYWKEDLEGKELLISQSLPFLVSRSLTLKKKVDVRRVYGLREGFSLFDFGDESIEDLKVLLIRCVVSPLYLKVDEGKKFLAFVFGLDLQLLKEMLAMIRSQIAYGQKSILEGYGEILFRTWKAVGGELKCEIENGFLQRLIEGAISAKTSAFATSIRRVLGSFVTQRMTDGVEKLLFRLAEPVIFRSLQVANSNVRLNALHLLLDLFPLEDPDAMKEAKDTLLDKQFFLLERLLMDDCPEVRAVAVEGCCRVLRLFWEIIPSSTITRILKKVFDDTSHDITSNVRLSTVNGIIYLLGNPLSHEVLKVLLPRLGDLILDNLLSIRLAVVDLLLLTRDTRNFQFNKVVSLDTLLSVLAEDQSQVAQKITRLIIPSYFPSKVTTEEACNRCVILIKRCAKAGARFCEFVMAEGASAKSLMELVRVLINLLLSHDKMDADQVEGVLVAASNLCNNLVCQQSYKNTLRDLFGGGELKSLFSVASTGRAKSSVLNILSAVHPEDASLLVGECIHLVRNCMGLSENVGMQEEVRSAHRLLLACGRFEDMFEALTGTLQKTAYRCHVKFGTELPRQVVSPGKKRNSKSSVTTATKWKHVRGKKSSDFEEDYSIAVAISWQIMDLLVFEDARKALLGSQAFELAFFSLKVIAEVSIQQCFRSEYMDPSPVLAYSALALHMTLCKKAMESKNSVRDSSTSLTETILDVTLDHLLNRAEKLLGSASSEKCRDSPSKETPDCTRRNTRSRLSKEKHREEPQTDACGTNDSGPFCSKEKAVLNRTKMLTAVLKFTVDSISMGILSKTHGRSLSFTSAYVEHVVLAFQQQPSESLQLKENELKEFMSCLKSSISYAAKLLNLILRDSSKASPPPPEAFDLVNNILDLISSVELQLGSSFAARLVSAAKSWLPDIILALGSMCIHRQTTEEKNTLLMVLDRIKLDFPSWLSVLSRIELSEIAEAHPEAEHEEVSEAAKKSPVFKKLMEMIAQPLKRNLNVLDALGVILLASSYSGLDRKDYELTQGLLHFVCVKLVGREDREWRDLNMMLMSLPDIYPYLKGEIEAQSHGSSAQRLLSAKAWLEPVWLYHVYETGTFTVMKE